MPSETSTIIKSSLINPISPNEYTELIKTYAEEGKTTGPSQNEDLIYYTKLNAQRSKRIEKTVSISDDLISKIQSIDQPTNWILITESWCGDAANSVPIISKLAALSEKINLKIVLRDTNLELMDEFLTNGGRSIPKLIIADSNLNVKSTWGPRPSAAQTLYSDWKNDINKVPYKEFQVTMQKWYNSDKGQSIQKEILELL